MKINSAAMEALFDLLTEEFKDQLVNGKQVVDKEGEVVRLSPDAATLSAIRQFLKDNNISVTPGTSDPLREIANGLPFVNDDHVSH